MDVRRGTTYALGGLGFLSAALVGGLSARFMRGQKRADQLWATAHPSKLKEMGAVKRLAILPLIDWYTVENPLLGGSSSQRQNGETALAGEAGVSYLIRADNTTILFDVGLNGPGEHPSPLLRNMQALEVDLEDVDSLVISHLHLDHVGGMQNQRQHTFALSTEPLPLSGIPAFVPVPMTHPTAQVEVVDGPSVIAPGVASPNWCPSQPMTAATGASMPFAGHSTVPTRSCWWARRSS